MAQSKKQLDNIKPHSFDKMAASKQREIASKGGKAAQEKKKNEKIFESKMKKLLSLPLENEKTVADIKKLGINEDDIDNTMALIIAQYQRALKGDSRAFEIFKDTIDGKLKETVKIETDEDDEIIKDIESYMKKKKKK